MTAIEDRYDVWMRHLARHPVVLTGRHHPDGNAPPDVFVDGFIHLSHGAVADALDHPVTADSGRNSAGGRVMQCKPSGEG